MESNACHNGGILINKDKPNNPNYINSGIKICSSKSIDENYRYVVMHNQLDGLPVLSV